MKSKILLFLVLLLGYVMPVNSQPVIEHEVFADGFSDPIGIVHANDDRLFIIEQRGTIRILTPDGEVMEEPFLDLSDTVSQTGFERGLLGLAFHPNYHENGLFFVNYTRDTVGTTVVSRFSVDAANADMADRDSEVELLNVEQPYGNHNGGQLLFGPDGYLYIALGDGGSGGDPENRAQNLDSLLGKMLRIDVDVEGEDLYDIPPDNPFVGVDTARAEIWAYGLRNPWRNSFDRVTGDFWIADVGQNAFEEINFQPAGSAGGENYGWRCYEADEEFNMEECEGNGDYVFPVFTYPHEGEGCRGSVTGGYVYRGALSGDLYGSYIFADYCTGKIYRITQEDDGFEGALIDSVSGGEFSAFGEDQYGELYFAMKASGEIHKISAPDDCNPVAAVLNADSALVLGTDTSLVLQAAYNPALAYQWYLNDEPVEGEMSHELEVTEEGTYTVEVTHSENSCSNVSDPVEVTSETTSAGLRELAGIQVYPNPASGVLRIQGLPGSSSAQVTLYDARGVLVHQETATRTNDMNVSLDRVPSGIYHLRITHDREVFRKKIIVAAKR